MFFLLSPSFHDRVTTGQVVDSLSALRKDNTGNLDGEDGFPLGWTWWFSMWFIMGRWPVNANKHVGIQWYIWLYVKVKVKWDEAILMGMRDHLIGGMSIHLAAILV